jgi:predicted cupin superfamily sugar epimerase
VVFSIFNHDGEEPMPSAQSHASSFALLGCTVAPGFDPADYAPADRAALLAQYPAQGAVIERLTHLLL